MKKHLIILALAVAATMGAAAQNEADTVFRVDGASRVSLINLGGQEVEVRLTGEGIDTAYYISSQQAEIPSDASSALGGVLGMQLPKINNGGSRWEAFSGYLGLGMVQATGKPEAMRTEMAKSFEIQWLNILGVRFMATASTGLQLGVGIDWRNYRMTDPTVAFARGPGRRIDLGSYPEGVVPKWSRIKTFSVSFPLMVKQSLPFNVLGKERFCIAAGAVFNINTFGSVKTCWDVMGEDAKQSFKNIGVRRFTIDLMGVVSLAKDLGFYVKYSPMTVLEGDNLQFHPLSVGLVLGL